MDAFEKISPNERRILEELRTLRPFERVEVIADPSGQPDTFIVHRSSKLVLTVTKQFYAKGRAD